MNYSASDRRKPAKKKDSRKKWVDEDPKTDAEKKKEREENKRRAREKVKPVVVKHVLTQSYIQKPEIFQQRPDRAYSGAALMMQQSVGQTPSVQDRRSGMGQQRPYQIPAPFMVNQNSQDQFFMQPQIMQRPQVGGQTIATQQSVFQSQPNVVGGSRGSRNEQHAASVSAPAPEQPSQHQSQAFMTRTLDHEAGRTIEADQIPTFAQPLGGVGSGNVSSNAQLHDVAAALPNLGSGIAMENASPAPMTHQTTAIMGQTPGSRRSGVLTDNTQSPRFQGLGQAQQTLSTVRPEDQCKDLIASLAYGMRGLEHLASREGEYDNTRVERVVDPTTGQPIFDAQKINQNFDEASIASGQSYNWSAVGEMTNDELDKLRAINEKKMSDIEKDYFEKMKNIKNSKQVMRELKEHFTTKEYQKIASVNFPSYGRGLPDPDPKLNTFMVQEKMCDDIKQENKKKREGSPDSVKSPTRKRIISPKRDRFEKMFQEYLENKFVTSKLEPDEPPKMEFDTTTKPEGTLNAKVNEKQRWLERERLRKEYLFKKKSLPQMERDAEEVLREEIVVHLGEEMYEKLREVFDEIRQRDKILGEELETKELVHSIAETAYFETRLQKEVRFSVDNEKETLESLLIRVLKYAESGNPLIAWYTFLGFFTRRGRLRDGEEAKFKAHDVSTQRELEDLMTQITDEDMETKYARLRTGFRRNIIARKMDLLPKTGKGKFNVTVPVPFDGMEAEKMPSTQNIRFQEMMAEKARLEEKELAVKIKARPVPAHVKKNKYERLLDQQQKRREEQKRLSLAKTKNNEAPFSFYKRDIVKAKASQEVEDLPPPGADFVPFRAKKIPWRVIVPLYKQMVDDGAAERERRVKSAAQQSLTMSKLPPRMELDERNRKEKEEQTMKLRASSFDSMFRPASAREVPDFKRLHREFASKLGQNKSAKRLTVPKPFNFHEPKNDPALKKHLDADNQLICPTQKKRAGSAKAKSGLNKDLFTKQVPAPPTTKKHEAMVALRRQEQTKRIEEKVRSQSEAFVRKIKAVRLQGRVKQSPVFFNNATELRQKRANSLQRQRDQTSYFEQVYQRQKDLMAFNVANRPLLFEQQTQEFINLYNQIKSLQKYVEVLNSQNLDANEFLNDKQKILLQRAEYFDNLNQLAYFPGEIPVPQGAIAGPNGLDETQMVHLHQLQQMQMDGMAMQDNGQMPVDQQQQQMPVTDYDYNPNEHYEQVDGNAESQQFVVAQPDMGEQYGEEDMDEGEEMEDMGQQEMMNDQEPEIIDEQEVENDMDEEQIDEEAAEYGGEVIVDGHGEDMVEGEEAAEMMDEMVYGEEVAEYGEEDDGQHQLMDEQMVDGQMMDGEMHDGQVELVDGQMVEGQMMDDQGEQMGIGEDDGEQIVYGEEYDDEMYEPQTEEEAQQMLLRQQQYMLAHQQQQMGNAEEEQ